jgi:peptidoglycan hydrolase-like protein with peptidoglycan-binding domain
MPRNLSIGMTGDDVAAVQRLLNYHLAEKFPPLDVDGKFGRHTRDAVIKFQSLNKNYPLMMPITNGNGVVKKSLAIDGIVGPNTGNVLLDVRTVSMTPGTSFTPQSSARTSTNVAGPAFKLTGGDRPAADPTPPPSPTPPGQQTIQFVTLQAGGQAQLNPWAVSPFVLTGQFTMLARNAGKPDFLLTAGGQFAQNLGTVNGSWSAQVFGQMGLGNVGLQLGPLDFVNPFVQLMLTKNQGQPSAAGLAIGNQINLTLSEVNINGIVQPRFSLFLNAQGAVNVGLDDGRCSAPALQGLLGLAWTFGTGK